MDIENENVTDTTVNENVDTQTTEQVEENTAKNELFTAEQQAKINEIVKSRVASAKRAEERKYSKLLNSLSAGMGTSDINELTQKVTEFYQGEGVTIPEMPKYSEEDENVLANAEAQKIIDLGHDAIVSEIDEMNSIGQENLSDREKRIYSVLANKRQDEERLMSLEQIGVSKDEYTSKEFKDFASKFNPNTSYTEIYELYEKTKPKQEPSPIGSMKSTANADEIKEYYSPDDFDKLTPEQLNNPKIYERVLESKKTWLDK